MHHEIRPGAPQIEIDGGIVRPVAIGLGVLGMSFLILLAAFFAIGGGQIVNVMRGPKLPIRQANAAPASDLDYLRQVVLKNERGVGQDKLDQFENRIRALPTGSQSDRDMVS